jgi:hypothetical protein
MNRHDHSEMYDTIRAIRNRDLGPRLAQAGTPESKCRLARRRRVEDIHEERRINQRDYQ